MTTLELRHEIQNIDGKPYFPSARRMKMLRNRLLPLATTAAERMQLKRYFDELEKGNYYDAMKVAKSVGFETGRASLIWRTLIVTRQLKRAELSQLKPCLVHRDDLALFVQTLKGYLDMDLGWSEAYRQVRLALQATR